MLISIKHLLVWLIGTSAFLWAAHTITSSFIDRNDCSMSYGRFVHVPVPFDSMMSKVTRNYGLYLFREGGLSPHFADPEEDAAQLGGTPVLFIPGNAGSYSQGRSMASLAANFPEFDWFLADFDEDLSAMHGKTIVDESRYVNDAIDFILSLYQKKLEQLQRLVRSGNYDGKHVNFVPPESVIIVGHSMGGIVARTLVTLDNYREGSVNTMITLSTPHAYPPLTFDRDTTQLYDLIGQWWREKGANDISLVSISGGHSDLMVLPDMTSLNSIPGLSVQSYEIPGVGLGIDHLAIVWCAELRQAVITAINEITDHYSPSRTIPYDERVSSFHKSFKVPNESQLLGTEDAPTLDVAKSTLYGVSYSHVFDTPVRFRMPAKSSLISYDISFDKPVKLAQRVIGGSEYRYYGEKEAGSKVSLMWYASGPYVPQPESDFPVLLVTVVPDELSGSFAKTKAVISVNWRLTIANILLHYRTLAACWPFALAVITLMCKIGSNGRTGLSFGRTLIVIVTGKLFWWLSLGFAFLHFVLISPNFRAFARLLQFPSEAHNVASLHSVGFHVHDLFLGLYDPHLFWIAPVLLAIACCAVSLVCLITYTIVKCRIKLSERITGKNSSAITVPAAARSEDGTTNSDLHKSHDTLTEIKSEIMPESKSRIAMAIQLSCLLPILYVVPYQCSTVFMAVIQLLTISDWGNFEFAFSQLLIWAAVVDAPVVVVWIKNFNLQWIWAFASLRNIGSALPLALYIVKGSAKRLELNAWWSRNLTLLVLGYIASYTIIYAGLHAFMLHHLVNYLAFWLLMVRLDSDS